MNALERALRWWSPKRYCRWMLGRGKRERREKLNAARSLSAAEKQKLADQLYCDTQELREWLEEMEDAELIQRARKMDVYLEDIPLPPDDDLEELEPNSHYRPGAFGNQLLHEDSHAALTKAMRERYPSYRKERREIWELWIKVLTLLIGLIGAATGLVALLKK